MRVYCPFDFGCRYDHDFLLRFQVCAQLRRTDLIRRKIESVADRSFSVITRRPGQAELFVVRIKKVSASSEFLNDVNGFKSGVERRMTPSLNEPRRNIKQLQPNTAIRTNSPNFWGRRLNGNTDFRRDYMRKIKYFAIAVLSPGGESTYPLLQFPVLHNEKLQQVRPIININVSANNKPQLSNG